MQNDTNYDRDEGGDAKQRPQSQWLSAARASLRRPYGPRRGPRTGARSAHQWPSASGSTWEARSIAARPNSASSIASSYKQRTPPRCRSTISSIASISPGGDIAHAPGSACWSRRTGERRPARRLGRGWPTLCRQDNDRQGDNPPAIEADCRPCAGSIRTRSRRRSGRDTTATSMPSRV